MLTFDVLIIDWFRQWLLHKCDSADS